ncbi:hypothetical protein WDW89_05705 [Deltaproteobacteria bacterium TL4]
MNTLNKNINPWKTFSLAVLGSSLLLLLMSCGNLQQKRRSYLEWRMPQLVYAQWKPGLHIVQGETGNALILEGTHGLLVTNAMYDDTLWSTLRQHFTQSPTHLIITDSSWESNDGLRTISYALDVFISDQAYENLRQQTKLWPLIQHHRYRLITKETQIFFEHQRLLLYPFQHTQSSGNIALYLPDQRILYTGMLFLQNSHAFFSSRDGNMETWIVALQSLQRLDVVLVLPGRGGLSNMEGIQDFQKYLEILQAHVKEATLKQWSLEQTVSSLNHAQVNHRQDIPYLSSKALIINSLYQQNKPDRIP